MPWGRPHEFRTVRIGRVPWRPSGATGGARTPGMQIPTRQARRLMFEDRVSLDSLYARFDAIKEGRATGDGWGAYVAVERLATEGDIRVEKRGSRWCWATRTFLACCE